MSAFFAVLYVLIGIGVARIWFPKSGLYGVSFLIVCWPLLILWWSFSGCGRE